MFGHRIPRDLFDRVREAGECFIDQSQGKPVFATERGENTVARCKALATNEVLVLSEEDRAQMNSEKLPLVLVGLDIEISEAYVPDRFFENHGYLNRPFIHGIFDCYTLIRDYYKKEFNIWMPTNVQRTYGWWDTGENLYVNGASSYGFQTASTIKTNDILLMKFGSVPSHAAAYMGQGKILHHIAGRFSCIEDLTPEYKKVLFGVYRHESMNQSV